MILKGQKRKLPPEDEPPPGGWESQRQFVFSVSLNKYQRSQELPEPSLRRSVLIANTLRHMSLGGRQEPPAPGAEVLLLQQEAQSCMPASGDTGVLMGEVQEEEQVEEEEEGWGGTDTDFSLSTAISSILTVLDSSGDGTPVVVPRTPFRALENIPAPPEVGVKEAARCQEGAEGLFQDIDTSLRPRHAAAAEELLWHPPPFSSAPVKCLPSFSCFTPPAGPPVPPAASPAPARESFELDSLMEILVES